MFNVKKIKSLGLAVALFYQALISWCGCDIICVTSFSGAAQWPMRARRLLHGRGVREKGILDRMRFVRRPPRRLWHGELTSPIYMYVMYNAANTLMNVTRFVLCARRTQHPCIYIKRRRFKFPFLMLLTSPAAAAQPPIHLHIFI
jgi:hypothetical protein